MRDFEELDKLVFMNENDQVVNNHVIERVEQLQARQFVPYDATVLELGARYGTVSCSIAYKLDDDSRLYVVEPDSTVINALQKNRDNAKCNFHIFNGVISRKNLQLSVCNRDNYSNYTYEIDHTDNAIPRKTLEEVEYETGLKFDCLVADCEGFLETFFIENGHMIQHFRMIILEKDACDRCNYNVVEQYLKDWSFNLLQEDCAHYVYAK